MLDFNQVRSDSIGKWPGIFSSFGINVGIGKHGPCPICGGKDRFRFDDKEGRGTWICNQCTPQAGDGFSLLMRIMNIDFKAVFEEVAKIVGIVEPTKYQPEKAMTPDILREIFKKSRKTKEGDIVHKYLVTRGLKSIPNQIRTTKKCWEPETHRDQNAMLAIFQLPDGQAVTMHRTYLDSEGNKLKIESPKKILPPLKPMSGGAVRLFEPDNGFIGISEGIETSIFLHDSLGIPMWAALSSTLLMGWVPPVGIKVVTVYGDNDANFCGQKAAYTLANKLILQYKIQADVEIPPRENTDFLDDRRQQS